MNNGDKKLVLEVQNISSETATDSSPEYVWISRKDDVTSTNVATSPSTLDETTTIAPSSQSPAAKEMAQDVTDGKSAAEIEEMVETAQRYAGGQGTEESPLILSTKQHFNSIDEDVNAGLTAGKYYKLATDIDLGKIYPIGSLGCVPGEAGASSASYSITYNTSFAGNLDGNGHKISYSLTSDEGLANGSNAVGLFGSISGSKVKNVVINANISCERGGVWVGGLAGFGWHCDLEDVTINGSILASHDVGGFFGYFSGEDAGSNEFKNCTNNANIVCKSLRTNYALAGGYIGQYTPDYGADYTLSFVNCASNGSVEVAEGTHCSWASMSYFIAFGSDNASDGNKDHPACSETLRFTNCTIGEHATITSCLGDTRVTGVYSVASPTAIAHCPAIAYLGHTSNKANTTYVSKYKVYVNNVLQDMSLYSL